MYKPDEHHERDVCSSSPLFYRFSPKILIQDGVAASRDSRPAHATGSVESPSFDKGFLAIFLGVSLRESLGRTAGEDSVHIAQ